MEKVKSGSKIMDLMLNGGYETDVITTVYGPAGSGKTILCLLCAINVARKGKKIIYIDTENSFSLERLKQIALDYKKVLDKIILKIFICVFFVNYERSDAFLVYDIFVYQSI